MLIGAGEKVVQWLALSPYSKQILGFNLAANVLCDMHIMSFLLIGLNMDMNGCLSVC